MRINYLWEEHVHTGRRIVAFLKHHHLRPRVNDDYKLLTQIENTRTHWYGKQKWLIEWVLGNLTKSEVVMVGITHIPSTQWLPSGKVWKLLKSWFVEVELSPVIQVAHFDSTLLFWVKVGYSLVMCRTPFYRTSIELEHHFSNIERTQTCSSIGNRTWTPYFWLQNIEY